jgi:general secretion pathway protein A
MYLSHYSLVQKPFQISPNPKFLWLGEKHREALATMEYAILNNQGFLVLTGDVGTGKTTLINALVNNLAEDIVVATIFNPRLGKLEFFEHVGMSFNIGKQFNSKLEFLQKLTSFLKNAYDNNKKILLIIDESQNLSGELLEEIRLLSNIEKEGSKLINIFFVGQDEFNDILMQKECRALRQRITTTYNIKPLTESETREYITHRLKIAGYKGEIFVQKAIKEIHSFSRGYPRLINIICDQALLTGYVKDTKRIRRSIISECAQELTLPGERHQSLREKSTKIEKKRSVSIGRVALYASLVGVISLAGYSLTSTGYANSMENCKMYYGELFKNLNLPYLTENSLNEEIKKSVLVKKTNTPREPAFARGPEKPTDLIADEMDHKPGEQSNLSDDATKPFSTEDVELTIPFDYNTNEIAAEAYQSLDEIAAIMLRYQNLNASVKGYTDALGRPTYNRRLSMFRANIVKSYLVAKGVKATRIDAIGMGEEDPLGLNTTEEGRRANRRVEIELLADRGE